MNGSGFSIEQLEIENKLKELSEYLRDMLINGECNSLQADRIRDKIEELDECRENLNLD